MRFLRLLLVFCFVRAALAAEDPLRIMFVGNSLTFTWDMPLLLQRIAEARGKRVQVDYQETTSGGSLDQHCKRPETLAKLRAGGWDIVVLQEHGAVPLGEFRRFALSAETLANEARQHRSRVMLYVTARGCDDAGLASHEAQLPLTEAYVEVSRKINARLIPVGPAFVALNNRESNVYLYHPDRIHPSSWGAYLAACVFYAVIFNESPAADVTRYESQRTRAAFDFSSFKRLSELVQQTAWETASAFKPKESAGPATTFGP